MNEDILILEIRKFLKEIGISSQREIEKFVHSSKVQGNVLQLCMTLSSETAPLDYTVEQSIDVGPR